ncbi:hypothetical protein L1987_25490 [Smallanthus sonchifolius]|uniref:Uncharacterized protein n=1 Tax=Smallanthus sonchifolius TaxID=185202 RepID=A0ACB9IMQ2_9ASTR|nr:hypothetical protein L1987_25490 [Smallanthus sonchifolius]
MMFGTCNVQVAELIEKDLTLIRCTNIEDKLQEGCNKYNLRPIQITSTSFANLPMCCVFRLVCFCKFGQFVSLVSL